MRDACIVIRVSLRESVIVAMGVDPRCFPSNRQQQQLLHALSRHLRQSTRSPR